jgi:hypothetical protein
LKYSELWAERKTNLHGRQQRYPDDLAILESLIRLSVPLFFMDLSKAEQVEANALTQRYNHLLEIGDENNCGFSGAPIPDFKKTLAFLLGQTGGCCDGE